MAATVIYLTEAVPAATESSAGVVRINTANGLTISDGRLGARLATTGQPGTVRPDGTTITVDGSGIIRVGDAVPVATTSVAGKVRPDGTTIMVNSAGRISAVPYTLPIASEAVLGGVRLDGVTITRDDHGVISAAVGPATSESAGTVRPDNETIVVEDGVISAVGTHGDKPYWDVRTDSDGRRRLAIVIPEG